MSEISFTEEEVKKIVDFVNFVFKNARWDLNSKDVFEFSKLYNGVISHIKKCESHIMELKKVIEPVKKESKK